MRNINVHIGLHKTGTTFLQSEIFPKFPSTHLIHGENKLSISLSEPIKNKNILITSEGLSGYPWIPYYYENFFPQKTSWFDRFTITVKNLSEIFPEAKIIIGFREQGRLILSLYKQYLHEGGIENFNNFFDIKKEKGVIKPDDLFFMKRIRLIESCFENRPFVYTFENFLNESETVINCMAKYMGIPNIDFRPTLKTKKNVGVQYYQAKILILLNKFDYILRKSGMLPTLNNKILIKMRLTPRDICQKRLAHTFTKPLLLPHEYVDYIKYRYLADWEHVKKYEEKCLEHIINNTN